MSAADLSRSFGRDPGGDTYGRHALIEPGGDNRQVDVIKLTGSEGIDLNAVSPSYVGKHRRTQWPNRIPSLAEWRGATQ
jgi:hypothetical protein